MCCKGVVKLVFLRNGEMRVIQICNHVVESFSTLFIDEIGVLN
jgi:hypothetical protein